MPDFDSGVVELQAKLKMLTVNIDYVEDLNTALNYCSVDTDLVLSIIMTESSFKVNAYNANSGDYGLMQVNEWHVKRLKLDKVALLTNVIYSVDVGCNILGWFTKTYKLDEAVMRFNVGTRKSAVQSDAAKKYLSSVMKYYNRLKGDMK